MDARRVRQRLTELIDHFTTSGTADKLKDLKTICKCSNDNVEISFYLLLEKLRAENSQVCWHLPSILVGKKPCALTS